jgi:hypothetical protein
MIARTLPLAVVPLAGSVRLSEAPWGGDYRVGALAACVVLSCLLSLKRQTWPVSILTVGISLGIVTDMAFNAWAWWQDNLVLLSSLGGNKVSQGIQFAPGALLLGSLIPMLAFYSFLLLGAPCAAAPPEGEGKLRATGA